MEENLIKEINKLNDQIEKSLIIELLRSKIKRDDIAKILKISSVKISAIQKYFRTNLGYTQLKTWYKMWGQVREGHNGVFNM